jgi:hypothetical protein
MIGEPIKFTGKRALRKALPEALHVSTRAWLLQVQYMDDEQVAQELQVRLAGPPLL